MHGSKAVDNKPHLKESSSRNNPYEVTALLSHGGSPNRHIFILVDDFFKPESYNLKKTNLFLSFLNFLALHENF